MGLRVGVLGSTRGTALQGVLDAVAAGTLDVEIVLVVSDKEDAPILERARGYGLRAEFFDPAGLKRDEYDGRVSEALLEAGAELVLLIGYMRILSDGFVEQWRGRLLNVHPSLLPAFPGLDAQGQALEFGAKIAGCTVHFVDEAVDHGVIILQRAVPVEDDDTPETLSARILEQEHLAYPEAIARAVSGEYRIAGRRHVKAVNARLAAATSPPPSL
jgi:phosphoribosylglycinamide formyltransferase-1